MLGIWSQDWRRRWNHGVIVATYFSKLLIINFLTKVTTKIRWLLWALLTTVILNFKMLWLIFWLLLKLWATIYFNIWSHWLLLNTHFTLSFTLSWCHCCKIQKALCVYLLLLWNRQPMLQGQCDQMSTLLFHFWLFATNRNCQKLLHKISQSRSILRWPDTN